MTDLVVVDFDRTLFNNHEFFQDFSTVLANYYGIIGQNIHDIAHRHDVVRSQPTGIFSAFDTIRDNHPNVDIEHLKQTARNELSGRNYLFADSLPFLSTLREADIEVVIMTVGADEYQRFKAEFAPEINVYEFVVTQQKKSTAIKQLTIARKMDSQGVVLIDDRGDTFNQTAKKMGIRGIRLRRVDSHYQHIQSPGWVEEVTSLGEVKI